MVTAIRQRKIFATEDYRVIYRAFNEINFAAYDFDTIRSSMIDYIRLNFSEDFNDWIESSEFVAIIELLAYLGQSLSFRMDLNTRENFIESAERRDSILKLARLVSFNPKRRFPATGLLKLTEISSNQDIYDSNGNNLSNITVIWNDPLNPDWFEQFILVLNSVLSANTQFGTPLKKGTVGSVRTDLYELNNDSSANRTFPFSSLVNNESVDFEIVNGDFIDNENFFERDPDPLDPLHLIYRNDGRGNDSANTGFFMMFKQGSLNNEDFQIDIPRENRIIDIAGQEINEIDVWVQEVDSSGFVIEKWKKVPNVVGNNVIFNSIENSQRNIFTVIPELNDSIKIRFADGRFGNVPRGTYRVWYRQSNGIRMQIRPDDMRDIRLDLPYISKTDNGVYFSTFNLSLQTNVTNSAPAQTDNEIKDIAPQVYYTQDRMVNGQDYNVFPLQNQQASKIKAVNRIFSGFSRYVDINDPTGLSQNINLIGEDGILYMEENKSSQELALPTVLSAQQIIDQIIVPLVQESERRHFFYFYYPRYEPSVNDTTVVARMFSRNFISTLNFPGTLFIKLQNESTAYEVNFLGGEDYAEIIDKMFTQVVSGLLVSKLNLVTDPSNSSFKLESQDGSITVYDNTNGSILEHLGLPAETVVLEPANIVWNNTTGSINSSTGRFSEEALNSLSKSYVPVGINQSNNNQWIREGSLLRFRNAGIVSVITIFGDGTIIPSNGNGPIVLSENVRNNDILDEIILPFTTNFKETLVIELLNKINLNQNFGLRYDASTLDWQVISGDNLSGEDSEFSLDNAGNTNSLNLDSSWFLRAEHSTTNWRFSVRGLDYIFESDKQIRFFHTTGESIFDPNTGLPVVDFIKLFKSNGLTKDYVFNIEKVFIEEDGYVDPRRIKITFTDTDNDGIPDDPTVFEIVTGITSDNIDNITHPDNDLKQQPTELFFESFTNQDGFEEFRLFGSIKYVLNDTLPGMIYDDTAQTLTGTNPQLNLDTDDVIYLRTQKQFYRRTVDLMWENVTSLHRYFRGMNNFYFQWKHFSPSDQRIDPAISNIIDIYVLSTAYDTLIRQWIDNNGSLTELPSPPTTEDLRNTFTEELKNKMISDEVVFHPVYYKILFGQQAEKRLRARFKVTKIPGTEFSDGEIQSRVINAINQYFAINNWDFGETFYFTEMAAFIHQSLATAISSIVLVPVDEESHFGEMFQIRSEPNEVFISSAKVSDVQVVPAFTDNILRIGN